MKTNPAIISLLPMSIMYDKTIQLISIKQFLYPFFSKIKIKK